MTKKMKEKQNSSSGLQDALRRRNTRSIRFLYEDAIQHCEEHLKECGKAKCTECKDAALLIPYYKAEMERELRSVFPSDRQTKKTPSLKS